MEDGTMEPVIVLFPLQPASVTSDCSCLRLQLRNIRQWLLILLAALCRQRLNHKSWKRNNGEKKTHTRPPKEDTNLELLYDLQWFWITMSYYMIYYELLWITLNIWWPMQASTLWSNRIAWSLHSCTTRAMISFRSQGPSRFLDVTRPCASIMTRHENMTYIHDLYHPMPIYIV